MQLVKSMVLARGVCQNGDERCGYVQVLLVAAQFAGIARTTL
jgi:hypothetical protein